MAENDYDEKRQFVRMRLDTIVTYTVKGADGQTYHGSSQNLSASGLYMTTDHSLDVGAEISIIMNSDGTLLPAFVSEGKVIRCIADENDSSLFHITAELKETN